MAQILVIDDDPAIQLVLKRTLTQQGYSVAVASNGWEGLMKAERLRPALVICDWTMPMMDGLEVCRRLKQTSALGMTFFILLTSRTSISDRVKGLDSGADDFLAKPIDLAELKARVRAALRIHQLTWELQEQKRQLEAEFEEASEYVQSLLPQDSDGAVTVRSCFIPSRQLGGDCFDFYWLTPDHLVFFLLDMSGHGLGAALPSVSILNLLRSRALVNTDFGQPHEVLHGLNQIFKMENHGDKYFTLWYGVYYAPERRLDYACAGHPPALLVSSSGGIQPLKTPGFPIGCFPEAEYSSQSCILEPGSYLYLFSDGIFELMLADGTIWGLPRWVSLLQELHYQANQQSKAKSQAQSAQTQSTQAQVSSLSLAVILDHLRAINGDPSFSDDISIMQIGL